MKYYVKRYGHQAQRELKEIRNASAVGIELEDGQRIELQMRSGVAKAPNGYGIQVSSEDVISIHPVASNCFSVTTDPRGNKSLQVHEAEDTVEDLKIAKKAANELHNIVNSLAYAKTTRTVAEREKVVADLRVVLRKLQLVL